MKKDRTQIKVDGEETGLLLYALQMLKQLSPDEKEARARLIKRLLKADLRIQGQQGMLPWNNPSGEVWS